MEKCKHFLLAATMMFFCCIKASAYHNGEAEVDGIYYEYYSDGTASVIYEDMYEEPGVTNDYYGVIRIPETVLADGDR